MVGDGEQTRDFTYVSDIADAFSQFPRVIFRAKRWCWFRWRLQHQSLVDLLGGEKIYIPGLGEPDQTFADISRIQAMTGWQAKIEFEDVAAHVGVYRQLERCAGLDA